MTTTVVWEDKHIEPHRWREAVRDYELSPLQLRAVTSRAHVPQAVGGEQWLLVNVCVPTFVKKRISMQRASLLLNKERIVILHEGALGDMLNEYITLHPKHQASSTGMLALIMDMVTECFAPVLDDVDEAIDDIEDMIMDGTSSNSVDQLFEYKKMLADLRRVILSTMLVIDMLTDGRFSWIDQKHIPYLRDSYDYAWRAHELIDTSRDLLSSVLGTHMTAMSNRMNDVMKRLTLVTTIFMPISFLAGLGGMNFMQFPFGSNVAYNIVISLMVVLPVLMIAYFWRKRWF